MEIWLKSEDDEIRFPVLPSSWKVGTGQNNTSENVHRKGEINLLGEKNLETIELSSFFPCKEYPFCQYKGFYTNPYYYVKMIKTWKEKKITPRLIITGNAEINMAVSIESFEYGEEDATGDVAFTLSLKEYITVKYSTKKKTTNTSSGKTVAKKDSASTSKKTTKKVKTTTYTVKKGDTLYGIAKKKTGKSSNWKKIYKKNKTVIEKTAKKHGRKSSSNGKYIYQGTKLVIEK